MTRAEQKAKEIYAFYNISPNNMREYQGFIKGYEQAERDLADAFQAGYAKELARADAPAPADINAIFIQGYQQAEKDLGWRSVEESLPKDGVFVFTCSDDNGTPQCVSVSRYDSTTKMWSDMNDECFRVDYWMPCPKLPEEEQ